MISAAWLDVLEVHRTPPNPAACPIAISSISGLGGSPQTKRNSSKRSRAHGSSDSTKFYDDRVLQLAGYIVGVDMAALHAVRDSFSGALALNGGDHVFKFRRQGFAEDEQVSFRDYELDIPLAGMSRRARWTAQFVCSDPRIYAVALKVASYDPTVGAAGTGLLFPLAFPLAFGGSGGGSQLICSNQGNFPTPPRYTITGPVTNPIIDNDKTGASIYTTGLTIAAGDQVVIDVATKSVTLNGGSRPDFIDSRNTVWGDLVSGDNLVRLRGTGMVTAQTRLDVAFRDARM
jgi:hypothetical protein